jgi:2-iminobutanoate/2-iminopropanoate deaminase
MNDASSAKKDVYAIGKKNPNLPFHPTVRAGDFIFVSGQVAKDAEGNMISGTIEEETRGTIEAIGRILAEEGATLSDVVRVTTYLEDARDFGRYNRVFGEHFRGGTHHRRGTGGDQHQDRNGRHCLQAAPWLTSWPTLVPGFRSS